MNFDFRTVVLLLAFGACAGCGPSAAERQALQRERLQLEETQRREAEAANRAITEMNKKTFGRKAPPLDLGFPSDAKAKSDPKQTP
jgi:hypothetical protein